MKSSSLFFASEVATKWPLAAISMNVAHRNSYTDTGKCHSVGIEGRNNCGGSRTMVLSLEIIAESAAVAAAAAAPKSVKIERKKEEDR